MKFKKKIVIVPFLIAVIFTLLATTFVVLYSYGAFGLWNNNKNKFESYCYEDYYNTEGNPKEETLKRVKLSSTKYQKITEFDADNADDAQFELYAYTVHSTGSDEETITLQYNLYTSNIDYKKDNKASTFSQAGLYLESSANLAVLYVKGIGTPATELLNEAVESYNASGSTGKATLVNGHTTTLYDTLATNKEADSAYVYETTILSTATKTIDDFSNLEDIYDQDDLEYITEGYTCKVVNYYVKDTDNKLMKDVKTFTIQNVVNETTFEAQEATANGYKNDWELAGYNYLSYVFPTLLWQGALTFVIVGFLGFLFYAIWGTEDPENEVQQRIAQLRKEKK